MKRLAQTLGLCLLMTTPAIAQENYVSEVWVADQGNGTYKNPILYADYSDPDACRVGDDFYMTSSSFNCLPGLQILHSKDLVNWNIIGAAVPYALPPIETPERPEHGNRVWAPAIRHHDGEFYIFWGDPEGPWSEPVLVKAGKGIIDTCPLWDEDGKVYLVHAYAGSRAGLKSVIAICELNADATKAISQSRIVFDDTKPTKPAKDLNSTNEVIIIISFIRQVVYQQVGRLFFVLKMSTVHMSGKQY